MDLHTRLANGLHQLTHYKKANEWINSLPVVTTKELLTLIDLPDTTNTRPLDLVDLYPHGVDEYTSARKRLVAAGLRHGHPLNNPRLCWNCDGIVDETTLACDCYTPTKTRS